MNSHLAHQSNKAQFAKQLSMDKVTNSKIKKCLEKSGPKVIHTDWNSLVRKQLFPESKAKQFEINSGSAMTPTRIIRNQPEEEVSNQKSAALIKELMTLKKEIDEMLNVQRIKKKVIEEADPTLWRESEAVITQFGETHDFEAEYEALTKTKEQKYTKVLPGLEGSLPITQTSSDSLASRSSSWRTSCESEKQSRSPSRRYKS
jgi:hypothetical protein